jgi:hypothetical protein
VRWLTIDFIAQAGRRYALEFGADVTRRNFDSRLRIERGDALRVHTGALSLDFPHQGHCPSKLRLGEADLMPGALASYVDHKGIVASTTAADGKEREIVVETAGPVRACVRVDSHYKPQDGSKRLVDSRVRYHFFAGLGLVKIVHEIKFSHSTKDIRWQSFDFTLGLQLNPETWRVDVDSSGEPGNQVVAIKPAKDTRQVASHQTTHRHYGNPECVGGVLEARGDLEIERHTSERVGEWLQVRDGQFAVTGSMRWFWQQFPVEWQARPDRLMLRLWSPRGGELDFGVAGIKRFMGEAGDKYLLNWGGVKGTDSPISRYFYFAGRAAMDRGDADGMGINKHHEFFVHFGTADEAEAGREYGRLVAQPPLALASGAWNAATDVMGPIAARPNDSPYEKIVDRIFDLARGAQDTFGDYGWWLFGAGPHYSYQWDAKTQKHYADPRRFEYHTYQRETQHWWNYLRSGERKFLDWCLPAENHWVDIAVCHQPTTFFTEYRGGDIAPATLPWPRGDWAIDSSVHYLRHHDTGEAWLRGQSQFWASYHRTLETTTLAYYLTGDERFNDVVEYWRAYWGDLAGKTSDARDFQPWHQSQAWYRPTAKGEKAKTWAQMIRDYAPFNSGSRHQQTLFFNLATLYEHTWDPKIKQALSEYAEAFLDPEHPLGVWRCQDNGEPIRAAAPTMCHYWVPALWRYARASGDPRMPAIFDRYFKACLAADPFDEDLGIYSNVQIGYAYAFSKDPRHLRAAQRELERLKPHAQPLAKPEDLGERLYNPYAPIRCFAAVPRLVWALQEAKRIGIEVPPPIVTSPQRSPLAWKKQPGVEARITLWGFDHTLEIRGPDGSTLDKLDVVTTRHVSAIQPFDRTLPDYEVFVHRLTLPKSAPAGFYTLIPKLEMALLDVAGAEAAWCHAAHPVAIHPGERWLWRVPEGRETQRIDSGLPKNLRLTFDDGRPSDTKASTTGVTVSFKPEHAGAILRLENTGKSEVWIRLVDASSDKSWLATRTDLVPSAPPAPSLGGPRATAPKAYYVEGRFGAGAVVHPGRKLMLPDHQKLTTGTAQFFDLKQGTLEFWIKTMWDARLTPIPRWSPLGNGPIDATMPWTLPHEEWAHVALVWRPLKKDPKQTILHVYINGLDQQNYRSVYWPGYGARALNLPTKAKWLEGFFAKAPPGAAYALDEIRLSSTPRYVDPGIDFGGQQTVNPFRFTPPTTPFAPDRDTLLLYHLDNNLSNHPGVDQPKLSGEFQVSK